jgi:hypothetical protein
MTTDKMHIKRLFENLLHYGTENCDCPKHTINWPETITADFDVKCNHFGNPCEKLGTIKAVDVDFYLEITPDVVFEGRSNSRLGLLEKATVVAKSVADNSVLSDVIFSNPNGTWILSCDVYGVITAKDRVGFGTIKAIHVPSQKTLTTVISVVAPMSITFGPIIREIHNQADFNNEFPNNNNPPNADQIVWIAGFVTELYVWPSDVSFHKLKCNEANVDNQGRGNKIFDTPIHATGISINTPINITSGGKIGSIGDTVCGYTEKISNSGYREWDVKITITSDSKVVYNEDVIQKYDYNRILPRLTTSKKNLSVFSPLNNP